MRFNCCKSKREFDELDFEEFYFRGQFLEEQKAEQIKQMYTAAAFNDWLTLFKDKKESFSKYLDILGLGDKNFEVITPEQKAKYKAKSEAVADAIQKAMMNGRFTKGKTK